MVTTQHTVRISSDGQLLIDDEHHVVPDQVDPSHVVMQVLHLEAAGLGRPVVVDVHDQRTDAVFAMQIMPDGSTAPPHTPAPTPSQRLHAAQEAGRAHDFDRAIPAADALLQDLTAQLGAEHPDTLDVATFRADLAFLSGDHRYATTAFTWIAWTWFDLLGTGSTRTRHAAQNAAAAWLSLADQEASALAPDILSMLGEVAPPAQTHTVRGHIQHRLSILASAAALTSGA